MKKTLFILVLLMLVIFALALSSCGCKHDAQTVSGKAATCTEDGLTDGEKCSICHMILKVQEIVPASGHNLDENCVCTYCNEELHSYENCICTECGEENPEEALEYVLHTDGKSYIVKGIGNHKGSTLIIPETHDGKPVIAIGVEAFRNNGTLKRVIIPSSVKAIGYRAFYNSCVESVELSEGLESIDYQAFYQCLDLKKIVLPNSLTVLEVEAFSRCSGLREAVIGDNIENIKNKTFEGCPLEKVVIGKKVNRFGPNEAFSHMGVNFYVESMEHWRSIENGDYYLSFGENRLYVNGTIVDPVP